MDSNIFLTLFFVSRPFNYLKPNSKYWNINNKELKMSEHLNNNNIMKHIELIEDKKIRSTKSNGAARNEDLKCDFQNGVFLKIQNSGYKTDILKKSSTVIEESIINNGLKRYKSPECSSAHLGPFNFRILLRSTGHADLPTESLRKRKLVLSSSPI